MASNTLAREEFSLSWVDAPPTPWTESEMRVKRAFDVMAAALGLVLLAPLLGAVALLVRMRLGRPVLFRQQRPGHGGEVFTLMKFRTMVDERDASGEMLADSLRLTPLGRALRRTSLDELPELLNVLKGDMSLVGPRPLLVRYTPYLREKERLRLSVPPGITGWAQVHGRNHVRWDDRLALDIWYVENRSFLVDVRILLRTLSGLVRRAGVVTDPASVMQNLDDERRSELNG